MKAENIRVECDKQGSISLVSDRIGEISDEDRPKTAAYLIALAQYFDPEGQYTIEDNLDSDGNFLGLELVRSPKETGAESSGQIPSISTLAS